MLCDVQNTHFHLRFHDPILLPYGLRMYVSQSKPAKTKKLIDAGKEIFQEWLAEEVMSFSEETNVLLVEMMLKITDKVRNLYLRDSQWYRRIDR